MLLRCLLACLISTPVFAAPSPAPAVPVEREFRDWVVTCDNLRHCVAEGADADTPSLVLRFVRAAGPEGDLSLEIFGADPGPLLPRLQLDGKPLPLAAERWDHDDTDPQAPWLTTDADVVTGVIDTLRNGQRLSVGDTGASLDGLVAALLFVDDVQQRLGHENAWIRRGDAPADTVPAAPKPPKRQARPYAGAALDKKSEQSLIDAAAVLALAPESDCDVEAEDEPERHAFRLNDTDALVLLECGRGAYQSGYRAFRGPIAQPDKLRRIGLPGIPGDAAEDWLMNADYDPKSARLSEFSKGRGLGDCGSEHEWLFDGRDFVLVAAARQTRCQGVMLDFPSLWRNE